MEIKQLDIVKDESRNNVINKLAPQQIWKQSPRIIVVGKPGSGKTVMTISLIMNHLKCNFLLVYAKTAFVNADYIRMREIMEKRIKKNGGGCQIWDCVLNNPETRLMPTSFNPKADNIVVFDDMMNDKSPLTKQLICDHFTMGREYGITVLALVQYWKGCEPKVRDSSTHICLFPGIDPENLDEIWKKFLPGDLTKKDFHKVYNAMRQVQYGFLVIDDTVKNPHQRLRFKWDHLFDPSAMNDRATHFEYPPMFVKVENDDDLDDIVHELKMKNDPSYRNTYLMKNRKRSSYRNKKESSDEESDYSTPDEYSDDDSGVSSSSSSKKMYGKGFVTMDSPPNVLYNNLKLIIGEINAGNDNKEMKDHGMLIVDTLRDKKYISRDEQMFLYNTYFM